MATRPAIAEDEEEPEYGATAEVEAPPSEPVRRSVPAEDLRKVAGARGDALRAVEILPGVARSSSYWGGAPIRFATEARYNRALCLVRLGRSAEARTALEPFAAGRFGGYRQREASELTEALGAK